MLENTSHLPMPTTPEGQPPSVASQLQAPSTDSMIGYEKDGRSTLSSRDQPASSSLSSKTSVVEGGAPAEHDGEKTENLAKVQTARTQNGSPLQPTETREDGTEYPKGAKLLLISVALCLSVFLTALE